MLATLMMWPEPCFLIAASAGRVVYQRANAFSANMLRIISSVVSSTLAKCPRPALLTSTSIRPHRSIAVRMIPSASSRTVTSARTGIAVPPCCAISSAITPRRSSRRAAITTEAPSRAILLASAAPMPDEAPVITATLPFSIGRNLK